MARLRWHYSRLTRCVFSCVFMRGGAAICCWAKRWCLPGIRVPRWRCDAAEKPIVLVGNGTRSHAIPAHSRSVSKGDE
jgi:hypothetical protein